MCGVRAESGRHERAAYGTRGRADDDRRQEYEASCMKNFNPTRKKVFEFLEGDRVECKDTKNIYRIVRQVPSTPDWLEHYHLQIEAGQTDRRDMQADVVSIEKIAKLYRRVA